MYQLKMQMHHVKSRKLLVVYKAEMEKPREKQKILLHITDD